MTITEMAEATTRREALQNAIASSNWETAFQEATWLSNHYTAESVEAEHYASQARTFAAKTTNPVADAAAEQPFSSITDQLLASLRAVGAEQTHAATPGITFNVYVDVELNKPPF